MQLTPNIFFFPDMTDFDPHYAPKEHLRCLGRLFEPARPYVIGDPVRHPSDARLALAERIAQHFDLHPDRVAVPAEYSGTECRAGHAWNELQKAKTAEERGLFGLGAEGFVFEVEPKYEREVIDSWMYMYAPVRGNLFSIYSEMAAHAKLDYPQLTDDKIHIMAHGQGISFEIPKKP